MIGSATLSFSRNFYTRFVPRRKARRRFDKVFAKTEVIAGFILSREILFRVHRNWLRKPVCHFRYASKLRRQLVRKLPGSETPLPVSCLETGSIHSRLASQPPDVREGNQGKLGH